MTIAPKAPRKLTMKQRYEALTRDLDWEPSYVDAKVKSREMRERRKRRRAAEDQATPPGSASGSAAEAAPSED